MNYIKQLQLQIDSMNTTILEIQKIENDIRIYLNSDKFLGFENKFVNPDDILRMLSPMRDIILQSEMVNELEQQ